MGEHDQLTQYLLHGLETTLTAVLGFFGYRLYDQLDKLNSEVDQIKKDQAEMAQTTITREELAGRWNEWGAERQRMHAENKELFRDILEKLDHQTTLTEKMGRAERDIEKLQDTVSDLQRRP